jgi:hypothetical protein
MSHARSDDDDDGWGVDALETTPEQVKETALT